MAADPHKYPYIFGWAFKEVRGNWIHILRQRICETRDASDTELRDMALSMFMPPVPQDYHQDATQCGVVAGGSADVSTISLQVVSYAATGGVVVRPYCHFGVISNIPSGISVLSAPPVAAAEIVCMGGLWFMSSGGFVASIWMSADLQSWVPISMPASLVWHIATDGNTVVAVGGNGIDLNHALWSVDGVNWSSATLPTIKQWYGVAGGSGSYVAVAGYGSSTNAAVASSDGGRTWQAVTLPSAREWYDVAYIANKFVAITYSTNSYAYSTNAFGTAWAAGSFPVTAEWNKIGQSGDMIFVSPVGGSNRLLTSSSGSAWSSATMFEAGDFIPPVYVGGKYLSPSSSTVKMAESTNGSSWSESSITMSTIRSWMAAAYHNDLAVFSNASNELVAYRSVGVQTQSVVGVATAVCGGIAGDSRASVVFVAGGAVASPGAVWQVLVSAGAVISAVAGGSASVVVSVSHAVAGGVVAKPYVSLALSGAVSGGAVAGGFAPEGFYQITFGGAVAGGAALEGLTQIVTGGAVAGGAADASIQTSSQIYSQDGVGVAVVSGTSSLHVTVVPVASGGAAAAVTSTLLVLAVKTGLGTAVTGGAASEYVTLVSTVNGGAVAGGTAPFSSSTLANEYSYTADGGSVAGGIADNIQYVFPVAIAGAVASGGYSAQATTVIPVAGGAVAGADAVLLQSAVMSAVGGAVALPVGSTSIGWTGDKTGLSVAGGSAQIVASIALYGSVTAVASGGVTVRATAYADSYGGAVGGGNAPFLGYGVLSLVVTAAAVAAGAGRVSSIIFSPSIDITWTIEDHQPRFTGSSADNRFTGIDTQIRFTGG